MDRGSFNLRNLTFTDRLFNYEIVSLMSLAESNSPILSSKICRVSRANSKSCVDLQFNNSGILIDTTFEDLILEETIKERSDAVLIFTNSTYEEVKRNSFLRQAYVFDLLKDHVLASIAGHFYLSTSKWKLKISTFKL